MYKNIINPILIVAFYMIGLIIIAFCTNQFHPPSSPISFHATAADIIHAYGVSDHASFAKGALTIYTTGWFTPEYQGLINLWPPGFMYLEGTLLRLFGLQAPLAGILQILSISLISYFCYMFRRNLLYYTNQWMATMLPLVLFISTTFRDYMLGVSWVVLGETFSIGFVLIGLMHLIQSFHMQKKKHAVAAGFFFSLSAYFRSQFEMFFMIATLVFIFLFISLRVMEKFKYSVFLKEACKTKLSPLKLILISLITFHVMTVPYKLYNYHRIHSPLWVQTSLLMAENNFITNEELTKLGGDFLIQGGANTGCLVDIDACRKIRHEVIDSKALGGEHYRKHLIYLVYKTFLQHPVKWISLKIEKLPVFWFTNIEQYRQLNLLDFVAVTFFDNIFNYIYIGCILFSFVWLIRTSKKNPENFIHFWLSSSILFSYLFIFIVSHYESRYFNFIKYYFFVTALICVMQLLQIRMSRIQIKY